MRFSVLTTLLAASGAAAAPIASSGLTSTSSATTLIKNLNTELTSSASSIQGMLSSSTDKDSTTKQVRSEFQKMTSSISDASKKLKTVDLTTVTKRDGGILTVDVNGKPVVPLPAISKRAGPSTYIEADLTARDGGVLTVDVNGKPVVPLPAISKREEDHIEVEFNGKKVVEIPAKGLGHEKRDDKTDLAQELKTAVDTVQGAADDANEKLGGDALKEDTLPMFSELNGLSGGVVSLLQL